ncbi:agmatinase [bacterium]|nr:agmatinase [bacterium]
MAVNGNCAPSDVGLVNSNIFGLDFEYDSSNIIILPVPWDVTTSYRRGAAKGPEALKNTSCQIEIFDEYLGNAWRAGIYFEEAPIEWASRNDTLSKISTKVISGLENGDDLAVHKTDLKYINKISDIFFSDISKRIRDVKRDGKCVVGVGGDHSVSEAFIDVTAEMQDTFSILHLDAHLDLRQNYEGFHRSHASVMFNCLQKNDGLNLVQVGARDFSEEEFNYVKKFQKNIAIFSDRTIKHSLYNGKTWHDICLDILKQCKEKLYITFDIDVLVPGLCPDTGTPVPGGLSVEHIFYLVEMLVKEGKTIVGADLVEISGKANTINMIVASRVLYKLCGYMARSQRLI